MESILVIYYLVLSDENNKVVHCLSEGYISGGVIDKKYFTQKQTIMNIINIFGTGVVIIC